MSNLLSDYLRFFLGMLFTIVGVIGAMVAGIQHDLLLLFIFVFTAFVGGFLMFGSWNPHSDYVVLTTPEDGRPLGWYFIDEKANLCGPYPSAKVAESEMNWYSDRLEKGLPL